MVSALIVISVLIALAYYAVAFVILIAPLKARWVRYLGPLWFTVAVLAIVFFFGCGSHHLDMAHHLCENPAFIDPDDMWHFLIVDAVQPLAALGVVGIVVFKGDALIERLLETLVRRRPELVQRLVARLEER